jgi:hypothetical protein
MVLRLNSIQKTPVLQRNIPSEIVQPQVAVLTPTDAAILRAVRSRQVARR